jgi:microcystin-dependent protein
MTVETEDGGGLPITKSGPYNGNGSTSVFDYGFQIQAEGELSLVRQNADLTEAELVLTTDYTVAGVGADGGGQVTLVDPATDLPTGSKLVIRYRGGYGQSADYSSQGGVNLGALEASLDKLTMHLRELKEVSDRAIKVDAFGTVAIDTLTANVAALGAIEADLAALAAIIADIEAVAAVDTEVVALDGVRTQIAALGLLTAEIAALGAIPADITAVAAIPADVTAVADLATAITALTTGGAITLSGLVVTGPVDLSAAGSLEVPVGTTGERPADAAGLLRYNSTTGKFEGFGSTWAGLGEIADSADADLAVDPDAALRRDIGAAAIAAAVALAIPPGSVFWMAMDAAPTGYLECDGSAVSRTTYANLFAKVAEVHGAGDGSTTFNLPDLRGEFIRGWDNARGVDTSRAFGSTQSDLLKAHTHTVTLVANDVGSASAGVTSNTATSDTPATSATTSSNGGAETRPRNVALMGCIKT